MTHSGGGLVFYDNFKILYSSNIGTAMSGVAAYPASGSYLDVSAYERVHILLHWGVLHGSDTPTFTLKETDSTSGTLDTIDSTLAFTPNVTTGDNTWNMITLEVKKLSTDHHFIALATSGTLTNGSYVDVIILGEGLDVPVTQSTTYVDSATTGYANWCG